MKIFITILFLMFYSEIFSQGFMKTYGGNGFDTGVDIHVGNDSYFLLGNTGSFGSGNSDVFLIKTDTLGNKIFNKLYGSSAIDFAYAMDADSLGNLYILSSSNASGNYNLVVYKMDTLGNVVYTKSFPSASWEFGSDIRVYKGFVYVLGYTDEVDLNDQVLMKLDQGGNLIERKVINKALSQTTGKFDFSNDSILITGNTYDSIIDPHIIKTDLLFTSTFIKEFNFSSSVEFKSVKFRNDPDSGFVVCGSILDSITNIADVFIGGYSSDYAMDWTKIIYGNQEDLISDLDILPDNRILLGGYTVTSGNGMKDGYALIHDSSGEPSTICNYYCLETYGGGDDDYISVIKWINNGFVAIGTSYSFGPGVSALWFIRSDQDLTPLTSNTAVLKLAEEIIKTTDRFYFNGHLKQFFGDKGISEATVLIYDQMGRLVKTASLNKNVDLIPGIYLSTIDADHVQHSIRFVVTE